MEIDMEQTNNGFHGFKSAPSNTVLENTNNFITRKTNVYNAQRKDYGKIASIIGGSNRSVEQSNVLSSSSSTFSSFSASFSSSLLSSTTPIPIPDVTNSTSSITSFSCTGHSAPQFGTSNPSKLSDLQIFSNSSPVNSAVGSWNNLSGVVKDYDDESRNTDNDHSQVLQDTQQIRVQPKVAFVPSSIVTNNNSMDELHPIKDRPHDPADDLRDELYKYMREEPGMFDWIQDALGDGVWYTDMADIIWYSPAFKALFGYTEDEVPNRRTWWQENMFPDDAIMATRILKEHLEFGTPLDMVVRYRHKDGSTVWVRCHGKAIFDDNGTPIRMLGAHNDLTELMRVQEQLKEKEAVLDLLCTTSLDGYWDWNIKSGALQMSTRFKNLLGYEESELQNRIETWWSLLHPEDVSLLQNAIENCKTDCGISDDKPPLLNIVLRYRRKNGTIARMLTQGVAQSVTISDMEPQASPSTSSRKQWVRMFGTQTDVTYLEEARAARDANAAKTTFLATMSHEIRTPLNAVLGMAQVLMTTNLTDEQKDCVTILHNSGAHLLSLINDILDFSQIEAGIIRLNNEEVDIQRTVRDILDVLNHSIQQKDVLLSFHTELPVGVRFCGDSERIRQIVFNVLGNAVKFTSHGSICVSIVPKLIGIEISIQDTGCGISEDEIGCIFDDFRQASYQIRSKYGGSGLGLSICKKLVHAMGGSIDVKSVVGKGTDFIIWLPGLVEPKTIENNVMHEVLSENDNKLQGSNGENYEEISASNTKPMDIDEVGTSLHTDTNLSSPGGKDDSSTVNCSTRISKSSDQQARTVYLYEELECESGSIVGALDVAGMKVNQLKNSTDAMNKLYLENEKANSGHVLLNPVFIILHNQGRSVSPRFESFLSDFLEKYSVQEFPSTPVQIYDVGKKANRLIPDHYKEIYNILPSFPTTDDLHDELIAQYRKLKSCSGLTNQGVTKKPKYEEEGLIRHSPLSESADNVSRVCIRTNRMLKILVAEDNIVNQKVIRRLLSRFPCEITIANNGLEAIEFTKHERWDLIFMDLIMPELDGLEACRIIRQTDRITPIVALTANASTDDRDSCLDAGMNDYITKPVSMQALKKVIEKSTYSPL